MLKMNFYLFTCLIININFVTADKAKFFTDKPQKTSVLCIEPTDCTKKLGNGYNCTKNSCECQQEEICGSHINMPKVSAIVNVIDEQCTYNDDCKVSDSFCNDGYCRCETGKVTSEDKRKCLEISGGLEEKCDEDIQCMSKEPNSICRHNKCVCNDIHNQDKFSCVLKIGLGGKCNSSAECSHIRMSKCKLIYCECEQGFVPSENKDQCLFIAIKPDDICEETAQCRQLYGKGAICRRDKCECDAVHTLVNNLSCPRKLKTVCDIDDECKMYKDDPSMYCDRGRCECSPLFIEADGVCNGTNMISNSCFLLNIICLINILFYLKKNIE